MTKMKFHKFQPAAAKPSKFAENGFKTAQELFKVFAIQQ